MNMTLNLDMDKILEQKPLVDGIVNKFYWWYSEKEDLYQAGMMGVTKALTNYKEEKKAQFSSYAYTFILGEITDFIRKDKNVKVSRDLIRMNKQIEYTRDILRQKLMREPTDFELSIYLDISEEELFFIKSSCMETKSLDETYEEQEDMTYYNSVKTYDRDMDGTIIDLRKELEKLSLEEKQIIYSKYYEGYSQSEISDSLGMSQSQVSRKENKILQKLKSRLYHL